MKRNCAPAVGLLFCLASSLTAQLVTDPKGIPRTGNPPVVFLNGFETDCGGASFKNSFGIADQVLQAIGRTSLFFNNCTVAGRPSIEALGAAFGSFLAGLTYSDGQPVGSVDLVAYSMGGLIVRNYLSGKQEAQGSFVPPASIPIGKAIFIATPHFGSPVGALAFGTSVQADELSSGSHFLMDLNTWNQNRDDLRGIDAIAIAGTGGTGVAVAPGFDDGLVALSSASLRFYGPGRTRVLPLCHVAPPGLITQFGLCPPNSKGVAVVTSTSDENGRIMASFLNGTSDWQSIGANIDQNAILQFGGGILVRARTANDAVIQPNLITATPAVGPAKRLNMSNSEIAYTDFITAGPGSLAVDAGTQSFTGVVTVPTGGAQAVVLKPGPSVNAVIPSAAMVFPLVIAPRMLISVYGSGLEQASVTLNGVALTILYQSGQQLNALMPEQVATGLSKLAVQNASGSQTVNVWIEPAFPAVFTIGPAGGNRAAAVNALTGVVVSPSSALRAGDYVSFYLTGLGMTQKRGGLDYAILQPSVSLGGADCPVTFAGAAPSFAGLDQINCRVPAGLGTQSAAPVVVRSGMRSGPVTTVALE